MRKTVGKTDLHKSEVAADLAYWLARPVQARIDALEMLRIQHWGRAQVDARVQRVFRIAQLKSD